MFRSDLKLTICYLSCFLQERKLVFSQGGFCPENSLFPRIDVCGTKVKLQLQLHRLSEAIPKISIVLGFPKSCARARFFVYSPPLGWHMYFAMCRSWSPHDTWRLCRLGGGYMKQPKRSTVRCMRAHTKNTKWIDCNLFVPYHLKYQIRLKLVNIFNSNTSLLLLSESRGIAFRSENCWKYNANEIQLTVMWQIWPVKSKDCKG